MKTTSSRDLIRRFIPTTLAALVLAAFGNLAPPLWAKPRPPLPPIPERCLLSLRFNETNWWGNLHPPPLVFDNIQLVESWSAYSLDMGGKQASRLQYPLVRTEAETGPLRTNLSLATGSLRFWFRPDWSSAALGGDGPGGFGRLVEAGTWTEDAQAGWWSLFFSEDSNAIHFSAQAHGKQINYLDAPIHWQGGAGAWHLIVLTYGAKASELYVDGALVAKGDGVTLWPHANGATAQSFSIGSDLKGENAAGGQFEEWTSFGHVLSAEEIAHYYRSTRPLADLGAITGEEEKAQLAYLAALREAAAQLKSATSESSAMGLSDGGSALLFFETNGLWLLPQLLSATNLSLTLFGANTNKAYDIYTTSWLTNAGTIWSSIAVTGSPGQVVFTVPIQEPVRWFRAFDTDWDNDGCRNFMDAQPYNPAVSNLTVTIESPTNTATIY